MWHLIQLLQDECFQHFTDYWIGYQIPTINRMKEIILLHLNHLKLNEHIGRHQRRWNRLNSLDNVIKSIKKYYDHRLKQIKFLEPKDKLKFNTDIYLKNLLRKEAGSTFISKELFIYGQGFK